MSRTPEQKRIRAKRDKAARKHKWEKLNEYALQARKEYEEEKANKEKGVSNG